MAADMIFILNKYDDVIGALSNALPYSTPFFDDLHAEVLENGYETFEFKTPIAHESGIPDLIQEENKVLIRDMDDLFHVFRIKKVQDNTVARQKIIFAETEAIELLNDPIRPMSVSGSPGQIMAAILNPSRWQVGTIETATTNVLDLDEYTSVLAALHATAKLFDLEIRFRIEFSGSRITGRFVDLLQRRGNANGSFFEYSQDIKGLTRTKDTTELATALIGVGKSDSAENATTFEPVAWSTANGNPADKPLGQDWVGDPDALQQFGVEGRHIFRVYNMSDESDPLRLLSATWDELQRRIKGAVEYEVDLVLLERLTGYEHKRVRIGDTITIKDTSFATPLILEARVLEIKRSKSDPSKDEVTLGEYRERAVSTSELIRQLQNELARKAATWEAGGGGMDVIESAVAPENPPVDQYWLNTSKVPNIWNRWDGTQWIPATPDRADQIEYQDGLPVEYYKPAAPGADKTSDNVSRDTENVGGVPANEIETIAGSSRKSGPVSTVAPGSPQNGDKWVDISTPGLEVWKRYNATSATWEEIGRISLDQMTGHIVMDQIGLGAVGTQQLADLAITLGKMANGSVDANKLVDNAVSAAKIQTDAITNVKIAPNAITAAEIVDRTIGNVEIALLGILNENMADRTILAGKLVANTITAAEIAAKTITAAQILASTITTNEIAANTIQGVDIAATTITGDRMVANTITATQIATRTISADRLVANSITSNEILANTITAADILANTITGTQIAARSIGADRIVANSITASEIAAKTITASNIAAGTITTDLIAAQGISADVIKGGVISADVLFAGTLNGATGSFTGTVSVGTLTSGNGYTEMSEAGVKSILLKEFGIDIYYENVVEVESGSINFIYNDVNYSINQQNTATLWMNAGTLTVDLWDDVNGTPVPGSMGVLGSFSVSESFTANGPADFYGDMTRYFGQSYYQGQVTYDGVATFNTTLNTNGAITAYGDANLYGNQVNMMSGTINADPGGTFTIGGGSGKEFFVSRKARFYWGATFEDAVTITGSYKLTTGGALQFGGSSQKLVTGTQFVTNSSETGFCGIGGMTSNAATTTSSIAGVGVNFKTQKTYVPSSIALTSTSTNIVLSTHIAAIDITVNGFWLHVMAGSANVNIYRYWRGNYSA